MLPLIKVPCIFILTTSLWVTLTPPQPPPEENEEMEYGSLEAIVKQRHVRVTLKYLISSLALIETGVLIAQYTHHHPYSRFLLSHLIFSGGAAERICMSPPFLMGTFMASVGGLIRYKCYRALGSMFTFEMSIRKDHILVTSGPYAIVRHPSYTGIILVAIAVSLVHGSKGQWMRESGILNIMGMKAAVGLFYVLATITIFGILRRMSKEDRALHQLAGEKWEDWANVGLASRMLS